MDVRPAWEADRAQRLERPARRARRAVRRAAGRAGGRHLLAVARPGGGREDQKRLYNHHKHRYTRNFQAVTAVLDAAAIGFALRRGLPARADPGDLHEFGMWW